MLNAAFIKVVRKIYARLSTSNVNWAVTAGVNLALQDMPAEPNDIDIQTDQAGAYEIERAFSEFVTKNVTLSSTETIRSHFGELTIDGIKVEIMGDVQKRLPDGTWGPVPDLNRHREFVEVCGMRIPVLSLRYEYQEYLKLGRTEKARMLKDCLREKG